ncbi:MAG: 16S rRNA (adenine(1518)-N(6)/adenine(1519)-N(6))-dimethyltransferase RsmA [Bacteroidetes bacterium]|nr:16S rRNA (adenine(1518)-N(6)/adenine(1519)-N(6))-dimethyltransferase RsmA [Bacteroidota bacterium]
MSLVRAKKYLGQHFLRDENIARKIVASLTLLNEYPRVIEVGPGMGVLTKYLEEQQTISYTAIDLDSESIEFLKNKYPDKATCFIYADFLKTQLDTIYSQPFLVLGNFPYNISSQILFHVIEYKHLAMEVVGMFQKEVAVRIAAKHGNKDYGILSVLLQAYYDIEYLFTVHENVFSPPPKVKSAVIRLKRNSAADLGCDEVLFKDVVKTGFNQRRKTLRNSLKKFTIKPNFGSHVFFTMRPEQLSVADFISLTEMIEKK